MKIKIKQMTIQKNDGTTECYVSNKDYRELEEKYNNLLNNQNKEFIVGETVKWCNLDWIIIKIENDEATLLLKNKLTAKQLDACNFDYDSYNDVKFNLDSTNFDWQESNIRECCKVFMNKFLDKSKLIGMRTNYDEDKYSDDYIRLLTIREAEKLPAEIRKIDVNSGYWTMSPSYATNASVFCVYSSGYLNWDGAYNAYGVRPVVKLNTKELTKL